VKNVLRTGNYGVSATSLAPGTPSLTAYATVQSFDGNIIEMTIPTDDPNRKIPLPGTNVLLLPGTLASHLDATFHYQDDASAGY
jgi:hypothetical protein